MWVEGKDGICLWAWMLQTSRPLSEQPHPQNSTFWMASSGWAKKPPLPSTPWPSLQWHYWGADFVFCVWSLALSQGSSPVPRVSPLQGHLARSRAFFFLSQVEGYYWSLVMLPIVCNAQTCLLHNKTKQKPHQVDNTKAEKIWGRKIRVTLLTVYSLAQNVFKISQNVFR